MILRGSVKMINRAIVIVLDSFGVGELPDAADYGDVGSNTLRGIYNNTTLQLPNMKKMGLYNIQDIDVNEPKEAHTIGAFGKACEKAVRKK
jgi:phosphopentomutase